MSELKVEYVEIGKLKEWQDNPRINDEAAEKLAKLIEHYGFINPIIATRDGIVRAGHTRLKASKIKGLKKIPVIYVDFKTEKDAIGFSIADNKSVEFSEWDRDKLRVVLEDLDKIDFDIEEFTGFNEQEFADLSAYGEGFERGGKELTGVVDKLKEADKGVSIKDENWFYVEFFGDKRYKELLELFKSKGLMMKKQAKHELDYNKFYEVIKKALC